MSAAEAAAAVAVAVAVALAAGGGGGGGYGEVAWLIHWHLLLYTANSFVPSTGLATLVTTQYG